MFDIPSNKNQSASTNPASSPKEVQKSTKRSTNETTSGDEPISQK